VDSEGYQVENRQASSCKTDEAVSVEVDLDNREEGYEQALVSLRLKKKILDAEVC